MKNEHKVILYFKTLITSFWREGSGRLSKYMTIKVLDSSETSNKCLTGCNRKWVADLKLNYFLEIYSSRRREHWELKK